VWAGKMGAQETSPPEELRPFLYTIDLLGSTEGGKATRQTGPPSDVAGALS
jgi:hypothetical protein